MGSVNSHNLNVLESADLKRIFAALEGNARVVGGAVRDLLLGREIKDIDLATPFTPEKTSELLGGAGIKVIPTGIEHGTVTAVINKKHYEITTLRRDVETDGRHAHVEFTDSWQEDAARRDFTINALYRGEDGKIYDYFGGEADLKIKKIRFIGNAEERIKEDYLRILRFFRFAAQLETENLDEAGITACAVLKQGIENLSGERIAMEMRKILEAGNPLPVISLMAEKNILAMVGIEAPNLMILTNLIHGEKNEKTSGYIPADPLLRLACLLLPSLVAAEKIGARWKLSNKDKERLLALLAKEKLPEEERQIKSYIRKNGAEKYRDNLLLAYAAKTISENELSKFSAIAKTWQPPEFPVTGSDLINAGIKPGKEMGETLKKLENIWEEKDYKLSKQELLKTIPS